MSGASQVRTFAFAVTLLMHIPSAAIITNEDYFTAERLEDFEPDIQEELKTLQYVLSKADVVEFFDIASHAKQRKWIDSYWKWRDPILTTAENEMLLEHRRRVVYSEAEFGSEDWPGWDERGDVYIRYGQPSSRSILKPEVNAGGITPPRELWHYHRFDMLIMFAYRNGAYVNAGLRAGGPKGTMRARKITDNIDAQVNVMGNEFLPDLEAQSRFDRYQEMLTNFQAVLAATPSAYPFNFEDHQLPFVFGVDTFRGGETLDRVDVNIEFVADPAKAVAPDKGQRYKATAVFFDTSNEEIMRKERVIVLAAGEQRARLLPTQLMFGLPPGFYKMAVTVQEDFSQRFSSFRSNVVCEDYNKGLAVSDVILASRVSSTTDVTQFTRGALEVVPHPARRYRNKSPVPVYFEIYNLALDSNDLASYTVAYEVIPKGSRDPKPIVSSSFQTTAYGSTDFVHFTVRTDNLKNGEFAFKVVITDDRAVRAVEREATFQILKNE